MKLDRTLFIRNNLEVLRTIEDKTVDLIYLDPPFNSNKSYGSPIGSKEAGFHFKDMWYLSDTDEVWWGELADRNPPLYNLLYAVGTINGTKDKSYLVYMTIRLLEMHRILKDTGSIYLHVDQTMSHSLKLIMDAIFGKKNFLNEIIWQYDGLQRPSTIKFSTKNDNILRYSKDIKKVFCEEKYLYYLRELGEKDLKKYSKDEKGYFNTFAQNGYTNKSIKELDKQGRIHWTRTGKPRVKYYLIKREDKFFKKTKFQQVWNDIDSIGRKKNEQTGYSTQKPVSLLDRIIRASSKKGDLILDPFCGCATACISAEKLGRKWIGIDISERAGSLITHRLKKELGLNPNIVNIRKDLVINAPKTIKNKKHILFGKQEGNCGVCKHQVPITNMEISHIVPKSKGGQSRIENLRLLCKHCDSAHGDKNMEDFRKNLKDFKFQEIFRDNLNWNCVKKKKQEIKIGGQNIVYKYIAELTNIPVIHFDYQYKSIKEKLHRKMNPKHEKHLFIFSNQEKTKCAFTFYKDKKVSTHYYSEGQNEDSIIFKLSQIYCSIEGNLKVYEIAKKLEESFLITKKVS